MSTVTAKNGIDVGRLIETIGAINEDPNLGIFTFRAKSSWVDGTHNVGEIAGFTHAGDEDQTRAAPFVLQAMNPRSFSVRTTAPTRWSCSYRPWPSATPSATWPTPPRIIVSQQ